MGGQLMANSMGLSFAFNVDPLRGTSTPALGQFYTLLVMLTFLALDGHLALIEMLVQGFRTLPVGTTGLDHDKLWTVVEWGFTGFCRRPVRRSAGCHGVAHRQSRVWRHEPRGTDAQSVCGRLSGRAHLRLVIVFVGLPELQSSFVRLLHGTLNSCAVCPRGRV